jgi:predicted nucleic acid-binding protein
MKLGIVSIKNKIIDANIFLELFLDQEKADRCRIFLDKIASGEESALISTFTVDSVLSH